MTRFYLQWLIVCGLVLTLALLTNQRYQRELASITPDEAMTTPQGQADIRVEGMVSSGSLAGDPQAGRATFELTHGSAAMPVTYTGPPPDNLRELKTLILIGRWHAEERMFHAKETAIVTNYGFVASAYAIALVALMWLLFSMSRRVTLLFQEIKDSKLYESEVEPHVDPR